MTILRRIDGLNIVSMSVGMVSNLARLDHDDSRSPERAYYDSVAAKNAAIIDAELGNKAPRSGLLATSGKGAPRRDAAETAGFYSARQLEYQFSRVLQKPRQPMTAYELFPMDTEVPFGARTFNQRVEDVVGRAEFIRSPSARPGGVETVAYEQDQKIHYMGVVVDHDVFSDASDRFAGAQRFNRKMLAGRDAIERLGNEVFWQGYDALGIWGWKNHPYIARKAMGVTFSASTAAAEMLKELHALVNYPAEASGGAMSPTDLAVPLRIYNIISQTRFALGEGTSVSVLEQFIKDSPFIDRVTWAEELKDFGGTGIDGFLAYRRDENGCGLVMPAGPTMLPMQAENYGYTIPMFGAIGGIKVPFAGHNILGLASYSA